MRESFARKGVVVDCLIIDDRRRGERDFNPFYFLFLFPLPLFVFVLFFFFLKKK